MQQIADWLKQLGMSEYAERTSVLRDLTDQDLKELGVSLGHRRKMLRAIAELPGAAPTSPQPAFGEPKTPDTAERRQVTFRATPYFETRLPKSRTGRQHHSGAAAEIFECRLLARQVTCRSAAIR